MSRIFDFTNTQTGPQDPLAWAVKLSRSFFGKVFDVDKGSQPVAEPKASLIATDMLTTADGSMSVVPNLWKVYMDRKSVYVDIEQMNAMDELVSTALDITADCCIRYRDIDQPILQFRSKNKAAQKILDDMRKRLDLDNMMWQIYRDMAAHGNEFREVIVDTKQLKIVDLKQTISYQIWPYTNKRGDKVPGWLWKTDLDMSSGGGQMLEEWQICPFIFGQRRGFLAVAPLASARKNFLRLSKIEDGMAVARLTRSYDKLVHRVPVNSSWAVGEITRALQAYKDNMLRRKLEDSDGKLTSMDNPFDAQTDMFIPDDGSNRGGVDSINTTNNQLANLNDVYYTRERMLARLKVPIELLQIMSSQKTHLRAGGAGGSMSGAEVQFARYLAGLQAVMLRGLRRLCDLELALNAASLGPGTVIDESLYSIDLIQINTGNLAEDSKIALTQAQAAAYYVEAFGALPPDLLASAFMVLDEDQKIMMASFLGEYGDQLLAARVKSVENEAISPIEVAAANPSMTPHTSKNKGSGNSNKSKAARSTEQKGGASQGAMVFDIDEAADLFFSLHQSINSNLEDSGEPVQQLDASFRNTVRQSLLGIAHEFDGENTLYS